ncbi:type VI secretion system baseplate subunit TssF [Enterovibrio coralii]|uniref:Type VI secretion protein n=1 Tax=Enterovibrio coralii TaxID=294935 RepID=A0A135IC28_9GAMM|nr:type VI secretion system baseplate subunit TssF [Enterovibrio coralii]KXF83012.1 type VI secretion protein [Enterovibrio coralii]
MSRNRFFRDELAFLREQGVAFTEVYPQLARFLNSSSTDPDVERLLEGFAFLTGRLREKVEDEFPELTHSIISMLWPNYLRPVPSTSIVQFTPDEKALTYAQSIERGTQVDSHAVMGTVCHFRTCRNVDIYPLRRDDVTTVNTRDASMIDVSLSVLGDQPVNQLGLSSLRFYLGGEKYSAEMLYLWLSHYLEKVEIIAGDNAVILPKSAFQTVGFDTDDAILPYPTNVYQGYRILQEYLSFPDAYLFFDIQGLGRYVPANVRESITLRFSFSKTLTPDVRVKKDMFELYCTPVINLFSHDADPIDLNGKSAEYKITPSSRYASHYETFSVDLVQGWQENNVGRIRGQVRTYTPFESFQHEIERARDRKALYYRVRVRDSVHSDGFDHHISFVRSDETECVDFSEAISLNLTCTNRQLPMELGKGDICVPTDSSPAYATFSNLTEPTAPMRPMLDGTLLWTLISNLSLNYLSLLSKDALSSVLRAYDFRALVDRQAERISRQRLDGIVDIQSKPIEKIIRGLPVRGLRSEIVLSQSAFGSEGELYIFGTVLSRFFSLYASINSFHELVVINADNQERYTWGIQTGQQPLI